MSATKAARSWNQTVSASIGASIAQTRQHREASQAKVSWWLDVPREHWTVAVRAELTRMAKSKDARWLPSSVIAWPV